MEKLRFSRFLRTQEKNGMVAIFHSLYLKPIFVDRSTWESFRNGDSTDENKKLKKLLVARRLIISDEKSDNLLIKELRQKYEIESKQISILYLVLTHKCNFRCKYCFEVDFTDETMMTKETAKKGIDLFANHFRKEEINGRQCLVILYGGEPLLNKEASIYAIKYIRALEKQEYLPKKTEIVVITNGSQIDAQWAEFFLKNNVTVSVSVDSFSKEINDECRIDENFQGTFQRTIEAIKLLRDAGIEIGISTTITPYNINDINKFPQWLKKIGITNFGLNRLVGSTYQLLNPKMPEQEYSVKSVKQIIESFIEARKLGIYEDRMGRKVNAFTKSEFYPTDCGAYGEQIVIQPNGDISICHADREYTVGHVDKVTDNFRIWNTLMVKEWKKRLPLYRKDCLKCEAIGICGGGCAYSAKQKFGTIFSLDKEFCHHTKTALDFLIWDLYEKSKKQMTG